MTEAGGARAAPSLLETSAVQDSDGHYVINGRKWFITGAEGARYVIIMARTGDSASTMFLADMPAPGIRLKRMMDRCFTGGHGVIAFDNLRVAARGYPPAEGTIFISLEDETGTVQVSCWKSVRELQREPLLRRGSCPCGVRGSAKVKCAI